MYHIRVGSPYISCRTWCIIIILYRGTCRSCCLGLLTFTASPHGFVGAVPRAGQVLIGEEGGARHGQSDGRNVCLGHVAVLDGGRDGGREGGRDGISQEGLHIISLLEAVGGGERRGEEGRKECERSLK